jgi:hypothetical protein
LSLFFKSYPFDQSDGWYLRVFLCTLFSYCMRLFFGWLLCFCLTMYWAGLLDPDFVVCTPFIHVFYLHPPLF